MIALETKSMYFSWSKIGSIPSLLNKLFWRLQLLRLVAPLTHLQLEDEERSVSSGAFRRREIFSM